MIRTVSMAEGEPGLRPLSAALEEEGFEDAGSGELVGNFARHLMVQIDAWQEPNGQLRKYIKPNDPQGSYLFNKIAGGPYGEDPPGVLSDPMPMTAPLPAKDVAMVKKWIESGASPN